MVRKANENLQKVWTLADRGMDLKKAWERAGRPTTFKNVQRAYAARCSTTAAPAPAASSKTPARAAAQGAGSSVRPTIRKAPTRRSKPSASNGWEGPCSLARARARFVIKRVSELGQCAFCTGGSGRSLRLYFNARSASDIVVRCSRTAQSAWVCGGGAYRPPGLGLVPWCPN